MNRKIIDGGWSFTRDAALVTADHFPAEGDGWERVSLPHTWNGKDGQDGGNDYYRGTCWYYRTFSRSELPDGEKHWIEFRGANASADIYLNGKHLVHHDGGYSLFRAEMTEECLREENVLVAAVDNSVNDRVYPQLADFTFYGGLYRDVALIGVPEAHFALSPYGTPGFKVTPKVVGKDASVTVEALFEGCGGDEEWTCDLLDGEHAAASASAPVTEGKLCLQIPDVHLWNGRKDPHLYTCRVRLTRAGEVLEERSLRFGCRTYRIDPEKGFILNGESYPLRGVCRHQDRPGIGNAILPEHHRQDIDLICEVGANTIRLAHYQHDQLFYDLCDERGLVVWAEIPYISRHMPGGRENTLSQMTELVTQNCHHASIAVWGLSNEITMRMQDPNDPDMIENHRLLNDLVHRLDPTRLTTLAAVGNCPIDAEYLKISDVVSYNLYLGWYTGDAGMNGPWLDRFHEAWPQKPIGISEYGAEALNWHSADPVCGDYTEEYQARYHEELILQLYTRPYLWATHVWNMFDFAADARSEGGCDGMNNKGLVTFDRSYRKDAFYAYKAWLSREPFVHLCGKRFINHSEETVRVTVYSNQPEVELFANGTSLGTQRSDTHFFRFDVPNRGETRLTVRAGETEDTSVLVKTDAPDPAYQMKEGGDVLNWFEIDAPEGFCSVRDRVGVLLASPKAAPLVREALEKHFGRPAEERMLQEFSGMPLKRILGMGWGKKTPRGEMLALNRRLNACRKEGEGR